MVTNAIGPFTTLTVQTAVAFILVLPGGCGEKVIIGGDVVENPVPACNIAIS
jgi:hypothetical protein